MQPGRLVAVLTSVLVCLALTASSAWAGPSDGIGGDGTPVDLVGPYIEDGELKIEVTGSDGVITVVGGQLPEWMRSCTWEIFSWYELELYVAKILSGDLAPPEEYVADGVDVDAEWNVVFCPVSNESKGLTPSIIITGILESFPVGGVPPAIVQEWIVARAIAAIPVPVQVGQSAPFGDETAPMITQLPTYLWVEEDVWQPVSATPPPVFGTTATATATPYRVEFFGPQDEYADCGNNTGPAYDFSLPDEAQPSDCTVSYEHSSSVGEFELVSKIYWEITWICTAFCGSGTLDASFTTTRTRTVRVAELQAIGTSIGSD